MREAKTASQSVRAIYDLLLAVNAWDRLQQLEQQLAEAGLDGEVSVNRQVWQFVLDLLDSLHALLGEGRALMSDIHRYVESAVGCGSLKPLPQQGESVLVGEAGHIMTDRIRAVAVLGMQDGVLNAGKSSLITEQERAALGKVHGRPIGIDRLEENALRKSDFYRTLFLPTERLSLSWSVASADGAALLPSALVEDIRRLAPALTVGGGIRAEQTDAPIAPAPALTQLALRLRRAADGVESSETTERALDGAWQDALRYLWHSPVYGRVTRQMLDSLGRQLGVQALSPQVAAQLFGGSRTSITRLETYAACPYQHYVTYGLKPQLPREFAFLADEKGTFSHEMLQQFMETCMRRPDWPEIDEETIDHILDSQFAEAEKAWADGPLRDDAIGVWTGRDAQRAVRRSAHVLMKHAANSAFHPIRTEAVFGDGQPGSMPPVVLNLQDGHQVALQGKIDRVDAYEGPDGVFLRVVDYKSSQKKLEMNRLWHGLQLQLMLYMQAVGGGMAGVRPAGAVYFTVSDPTIEPKDETPQAIEAALLSEMRLRGVVLNDPAVISAMDRTPGISMSKMINADGSVSERASALSGEELELLMDHASRRAAQAAQSIRRGEIAPMPVRDNKGDRGFDPCRWCDYAALCPRDTTLPDCPGKVMEDMNLGQLLDSIRQEETADK